MTDGPLVCVELLRRRGDHTRNTDVISMQIKPALEAEHWELLAQSLTSAGKNGKEATLVWKHSLRPESPRQHLHTSLILIDPHGEAAFTEH